MTSIARGNMNVFKSSGAIPVGFGVQDAINRTVMPTAGTIFYLDPANGNDGNDGKSVGSAFATLPVAYAALTANQNDILIYLAGATAINLSATLTWAKDYTHFVGVCAPTSVANRARIFQTSTATGLSPLIDITATGCIFRNLYIFQGVNDATSLIDVRVTGQRNFFEDVHFAGGGHATQAIAGGSSLTVTGSENRFVHCTVGVDTIAAATGMAALNFDGSASRNIFEDCLINLYIGNAGAVLVNLATTTALDRYTIFRRCLFFANSTNKATTASSAFVIPSGHTTTATIFLLDCAGLGFTDWDAGNRALIYLNNGTITGGGNAGFAVVSATV